MRHALMPFCDSYRKRELVQKACFKLLSLKINLAPSVHITASEARKWVGAKQWENAYSFAVVRNPWDWQVSLYHYILREKNHGECRIVSRLDSFDEYIQWRCNGSFQLQSQFLADEGGSNIIVKDVLRFETLYDDFSRVAARFNQDLTLDHLNATKHRHYRSYYSEASKILIKNCFARDIEMFGYDF